MLICPHFWSGICPQKVVRVSTKSYDAFPETRFWNLDTMHCAHVSRVTEVLVSSVLFYLVRGDPNPFNID